MYNPRASIVGTPIRHELDGVTDDLLTAGLGLDGLRGAPPGFADSRRPTVLELRRRAVYMNYRGLVDVTVDGGFGRLYGPVSQLPVAGVEYLFAIRAADGTAVTAGLLQIPREFDPGKPRLVAAASSGSRGVYGALPTAAEWGLRHGCAVVHTDKGTGMGVFDVDRGLGIRIDGAPAEAGDPWISFVPTADQVERLRRQRSHCILFSHASSGVNLEAHWGACVLRTIDAALQLLNQEYPRLDHKFTPENTQIIASGISNGGGAVLRAVECDCEGWIDAAVVSEPNVAVTGLAGGLAVESGGYTHTRVGAGLYDYATQHLLLQPCALLEEAELSEPVRRAIGPVRAGLEQWSRTLADLGILDPADYRDQNARRRLLESGVLTEALQIGHLNVTASVWAAVAAAYASAYARSAPDELTCGISFAATDDTGVPRALTDEEFSRVFCDGNGIAPTAKISLIAPDSTGQLREANQVGAVLAARLRALHTGELPSTLSAGGDSGDFEGFARRLGAGVREIEMTASLNARPVIILHGRADALIPVNHASRAYYAVNQRHSNPDSEVRYYEIEHGQHFDAFLALPDLARRYVPLQPHLLQAMDLMADHLAGGAELPPSQVVRSRPRGVTGNGVAPLLADNLGSLRDRPGPDGIELRGDVLHVP